MCLTIMLSEQDKQFLLNLARITLENKESNLSDIPSSLLEKGTTFVSLYKDNILINSIGSLRQTQEIFQEVIQNIESFGLKETNNLKIEISIIKNHKKLKFETQEELLSQIIPNLHGIALVKNNKTATLLPNIWNQIHDKEEFLNQICYKLKLGKDSWKTNSEIFTYETETFREN